MNSEIRQRLIVYIILAILPAWVDQARNLTPDVMMKMTWVDWSIVAASVLIPAGVTYRAFIDQAVKRYADAPEPPDPKP